MSRLRFVMPVLFAAVLAPTASALPPGDAQVRHHAEGANHHIGDDSFIVKFGRAPRPGDPESVRMKTHLQHVHDWLAKRPATKPELAARRTAILEAFQTYIDKGTTPRNVDLPWRTPVFIDEEGTICAVGYLIQSTEGRELPEKIASAHRFDFIEDIAQAMPEVRHWVDDSGFTLEEIQTIQPAYAEPAVREWRSWDLVKYKPIDGVSTRYGSGHFKGGNMDGEWQVFADQTGNDHQRASAEAGESAGHIVIGRGVMKHGRGEWTSYYPTGEKLAEGHYADNQPDGHWKLFHKSGNLAAEGAFDGGTRVGRWKFFYDTPAQTLMATGRFAGDGQVDGLWRHYDQDGKLLARSWIETPTQWNDTNGDIDGGQGSVLDVVAGADGIHHAIHQGTPGQEIEFDEFSLELFDKGSEKLYISKTLGTETWYDARGAKLVHDDSGTWTASDCHWGKLRKEIAAQGDVARLDGVLSNAALLRRAAITHEKYERPADPGPTCTGEAVTLSAKRSARLDELLAARDQVRSVAPKDLILGQEDGDAAEDMPHLLAGHMAMFIEWPHIDRRFKEVYETMAGRFSAHWAGYSEDMRDPNG